MNFSVLLSNFLRICGFESTFYIPQIGEPFCFGEAIMGGASPKIGHGILPFSVLTNITPSDQKHPWSSKNLSCRTRWWFQIFFFHPYLGKWSNLTSIFQTGWNHQLENHALDLYLKFILGFSPSNFIFSPWGKKYHSIPTKVSTFLTSHSVGLFHQPSKLKVPPPKPQNPVETLFRRGITTKVTSHVCGGSHLWGRRFSEFTGETAKCLELSNVTYGNGRIRILIVAYIYIYAIWALNQK